MARTTKKTVGRPAFAGLGYEFSGYWVLDKSRSESSAVHLEGMGLPDMAQIAAQQVEPAYRIVQEGHGIVTIRHISILGEKERRLVVGEEHREWTKDGAVVKMVLEQPGPTVLRITIDWSGRGRIIDTKSLLDGGAVIHQHIEFMHKSAKDKKTISNRYFVRGAEPRKD